MNMKNAYIFLYFIPCGCAPSLEDSWVWDNEQDTAETVEEDLIRQINATSYEEWVYLDIESNIIVDVDDPETSEDWDIGVQRYHIKLNSGIHGPATVQGLVIEEEDFSEYTHAPLEGYQVDQPDDDDDGIPSYVFSEWYDYDPSTHILTPAEHFYVLSSRNEEFFKIQIQNYYNDAGTPGYLTLYWEAIEAFDHVE